MFKKFLQYGLSGGLAFVADFLFIFALFTYTNLHYTIIVTLGFLFGTICNYTVNKLWVFKESKQTTIKGYGYFLLIALSGLLLTLGILSLMVEVLHVHVLVARVIAAGLVYFWSFGANYFLNFKANK